MKEQTAAPEAAPERVSVQAAPPGGRRPASDSERFIARAATVTAVLTAAGTLLGLVRDQLIARFFGAGGETDAFLVAWTVPEFAATFLIDDAMALVMIPAFSLALSRRAARRAADPDGPDPVHRLVLSTAPQVFLWLACGAALLAAGAPALVRLMAPGLPDPGLAAQCTRLTALTVLGFGVAGYFSAALRAHRRFVPPAVIYVAYNAGIIAVVLVLHRLWGVRAAAAGVAAGSALMVLVQLPSFVRHLLARSGRPPRTRELLLGWGRLARAVASARAARRSGFRRLSLRAGLAVLAPVATYTLARQSQVLVERHFASLLPAGAISHLNYAQKVAQVPMILSVMVVTVTFPLVARAMADGDAEHARRRAERDLTLAGLVVLLGAAYVVAYAPQLIEVLFQRGAFGAHDTEATAAVMRVYALGLLGQSLTSACIRPFFSVSQPTWRPAAGMGGGLLLTIVVTVVVLPYWGAPGIAAANSVGISVTALLLLHGLRTRGIAINLRRVATGLLRLAVAAGAAAAAGWAAAPLIPSALGAVATGCLVVPAVFAAAGFAVQAPEIQSLVSVVERRLRHAR